MKKKRLSTGVETVADMMPALSKHLKLDNKVREWSILTLWEKTIDPVFVGKTTARRIETRSQKTCLYVTAANATVASELHFRLPQYCERLNAYRKETGLVIDEIKIQLK